MERRLENVKRRIWDGHEAYRRVVIYVTPP